ncbi:YggS family pyridoxal phosphate-dependent enzyme [Allochromatium vinosum]|uniref:Pyridoxal phosphate homeostasis protein n=1 Tax=Allochromatium vinosum (strain ATCC 17899 / DSM 180 / NBRC 103801 / NCIMB 10441 / D) TaxID=572477 RepID=D3RQW7_ALLVD|nr:YggS family pyridoxal phosphate-dependent enzyme [Allochromatium vinosum]ADC63801.1 alanine racemase domain protein [Allochromatium vinosum DSM 180]
MTPSDIAQHRNQVLARIQAAIEHAGRPAGSVALIAVSKKQPAEAIRAAHAAGQRAFGESYLQEALDKQALLVDLSDIEWHFIGRIQSNKTRQIAAHFDWVHGLADLGHARRLSEQRPASRPPLNVCLQVNLSGETSKGGVAPDAVGALLEPCRELPGLRVRGLMTLPAPSEDETEQRRPFRALRELRDRLATPDCPLEVLSMGMSDDMEAAILEGATQVRIGTAVFGVRSTD